MTDPRREVDDGVGGIWLTCSSPTCDLHVVRPGRIQCHDGPDCGHRAEADEMANQFREGWDESD